MSKTRLPVAALLGIGIVLGFGQPLAFSQSSAPAEPPAPLKEIHVDRKCTILQDESDALSDLTEAELRNDHAICHLFRVNAEPGQIVRMHVGEHHADPIADTN